MNTQGEKFLIQPNRRFKNTKYIFQNLIKQVSVPTEYDVLSIAISNDSKNVISLTKNEDHEIWITEYCLEKFTMLFQERIGEEGSYIKCKEIEQTGDGKKFALCYNLNKQFYLRQFERK